MSPYSMPGPITIIFLTEAHVSPPSPLTHADMVHHEQVDIQVICAGPPHTLHHSAHLPHHLDTAPLAPHYPGHVLHPHCPVERVLAPWVRPAGAGETVYTVAS